MLPLLSIVLGLLLVFRNSTSPFTPPSPSLHSHLPRFLTSVTLATSYNCYWEGRKYINAMNNQVRNLSRLIWITIPEPSQVDHILKINHIKMLLGFTYAVRHALLEEGELFQDLEKLLPDDLKDSVLYEQAMPLPYQISYKVTHPRSIVSPSSDLSFSFVHCLGFLGLCHVSFTRARWLMIA